jgi:hypothetical protein
MAKNERVQALNSLLQQMQSIDPKFAVIVTAAGIAGAAGIKGPLTTLVNGLAKIAEDTSNSSTWHLITTPGYELISEWFGGNGSSSSSNPSIPSMSLPWTDEQKKAFIAMMGTAAGNMVEAGLMYTLVQNPETLRALFDMSKEAAKGAIGLASTGAALLKA